MVNDLTSDTGITQMIVATTRVMPGLNDATFLYRDESIAQIVFNIYLVFADGTTRNVTHELTNGSGRLQVTGLDLIDTAVVTGNNIPRKFTVTYYAINGDGTLNVVNNIYKDIDVFVIDDETAMVDSFIPVYYVDSINLGGALVRKYFTVRDNGTIADVTGSLKSTSAVVNSIDVEQPITTVMNLGITGQIETTYQYTVRESGINPVKVGISLGHGGFSHNEVSGINLNTSMGTATLASSNGANPAAIKLANRNSNGVEPTHFNVRNVSGSHNFTTAMLTIESYQNFVFTEGGSADKRINATIPVLIEFLRVTTNGGVTTSVVTKLRVAYVTVV
jgi:hypothetical protein